MRRFRILIGEALYSLVDAILWLSIKVEPDPPAGRPPEMMGYEEFMDIVDIVDRTFAKQPDAYIKLMCDDVA